MAQEFIVYAQQAVSTVVATGHDYTCVVGDTSSTIVAQPSQEAIVAVAGYVVTNIGTSPSANFNLVKFQAEAGVLTYVIPQDMITLSPLVFVNGVQTNYTLDGVHLTLTDYTAGEIDSADEITFYY